MERIHARALETENRVRMLETHGLRLQAQQTMLTTISTQATLLLGFALATYGADLLPYILNDDSPFCLYKNGASMVIGFIFLLANTCCICFCMMVLIASSLLVIQSQNAYLLVGGEVAVWRTQQLSSKVFYWYGLALCCFLLDAVLLMWIFLGVPHWVPNANPGINSEDVLLTDGTELLRCIDDTDPKAHASRDSFGYWNAIASTIFFIGFVIYGVQKMREFVHLYTLDELRGGDEVVREEQRKSRERDLRREVELAKMRLADAQSALKDVSGRSVEGETRDQREIGKKTSDLDKAKRKLAIANQNLNEFRRQQRGTVGVKATIFSARFLSKLRSRRTTKLSLTKSPNPKEEKDVKAGTQLGAPSACAKPVATTTASAPAAGIPAQAAGPPAGARSSSGTRTPIKGSSCAEAPSSSARLLTGTAAKCGTGLVLNKGGKPVIAVSPRANMLGDPTGPQDDEMDSTA